MKKNLKLNYKKSNGITLIALVVTIIVLIILAGISIHAFLGDDGIMANANEIREEQEKNELKEKIRLEILSKKLQNIEGITHEQIVEILRKYGTVNYYEEGKIKSLTPTGKNYEILFEEIYNLLPMYILSLNHEEKEIENILPGEKREYFFSVSNFENDKINEVLLKYHFEINLETEIPLEVKIYDITQEGISEELIITDKKTQEISMGYDTEITKNYKLEIIWDKNDNDLKYVNKKATCNVKLQAIHDRYIIKKDFDIDINSSQFFFNAELEKQTVVMDNTGANINLKINNYVDNEFNEYPVNYKISVINNDKYSFLVDDEQAVNNVVKKTINGEDKIDDMITIRLTTIQNAILNSEEQAAINIKTTSPYEKEINLPVNINTNPSTLSGIELNFLIKNGAYAPEGDVYEYYSVDANRMQEHTITKIVFGKYSDYQSKVSGVIAEPIDVNRVGVINLYRVLNSDNATKTIYILSRDGKFELSENAAWTFDKLYALETIENLHLLDTSKVTNMRDMFCDCAALTKVDLSNFETSNVTDMIGMFARMYAIQYIDLLSFDTQSLTKAGQMFTSNKALKAIYVSENWDISNITEGTNMFAACEKLVGQSGTAYNSSKIDYTMATTSGYLTGVYNLLEGLNVNHIIKAKTQKEIDAWDINNRYVDTNVTSITFGRTKDYYSKVQGYTGVPVDMQRTGGIQVYRIPNGSNYSVYILSNSGKFIANSDSSWLFDKLPLLTNINNLNLLDTSKVTLMRDMFCDCHSLASIDLSNFNTQKVTSMVGMFARMYTIKELDLSSFNTSNVTAMSSMFALSISETETLESFKNAIPALKTVYVSNLWTTSKLTAQTESMFANNVNLVGGAGTIFSSTNTTATYARVDTASTLGYFTLK